MRLAALFPLCLAAPAAAMPPEVKAMLDGALSGGDAAEIAAVAKYARLASPDDAPEIDALIAARRSGISGPERIAPPPVQITAAPPPAGTPAPPPAPTIAWKGRAELGGFFATGNSRYVGATTGVNLTREEEKWRHTLVLQGDYQETEGVATRERLLASWQPRYQLGTDGFSYGLAQYEHDPFLGYTSRYTLSGGVGYRMGGEGSLTLDLEAGPAIRLTDQTIGHDETMIAGRGSMNFAWKPSKRLAFTQDTAVYADSQNRTLNGTTALTTKLSGPLSARLSYNIQYESNPPDGLKTTNTLSRASLVYDF